MQSCTVYYPRRLLNSDRKVTFVNDKEVIEDFCLEAQTEQRQLRILGKWQNVKGQLEVQSLDNIFYVQGNILEFRLFEILATSIVADEQIKLFSFIEIKSLYNQHYSINLNFLQARKYYYWDESQKSYYQFEHSAIITNPPLLHHIEDLVESQKKLKEIYEVRNFILAQFKIEEIIELKQIIGGKFNKIQKINISTSSYKNILFTIHEIEELRNELQTHNTDKAKKYYLKFADENIEKFHQKFIESAGYILREEQWWQPSLNLHYNKENFFLPIKMTSVENYPISHPLWQQKEVKYDRYQLLTAETKNYLFNASSSFIEAFSIIAENNYFVLQPYKVKDANENISEVLFDALGVAVITSAYGKVENQLTGFDPLNEEMFKSIIALPLQEIINNAQTLLQKIFQVYKYDLTLWFTQQKPNKDVLFVNNKTYHSLSSLSTNVLSKSSSFPITLQYYDSTGTVIQRKVKTDEKTDKQWLISEYLIYNNQGSFIEQYEPFYSKLENYESPINNKELALPTKIYRDILYRITQVYSPKKFINKIKYTPWYEHHDDENDTCLESFYFQELKVKAESGDIKAQEELESLKNIGSVHQDTPTLKIFNSLGQAFLYVNVAKEPFDKPSTVENIDPQNVLKNSVVLLKTKTTFNAIGQVLDIQDPRFVELQDKHQIIIKNIRFINDKLGSILKEERANSGRQLYLYNCFGNKIHQWNSRDYHFTLEYDNWNRVHSRYVEGGEGKSAVIQRHCYEKILYGEFFPQSIAKNLRGKPYAHYDQSGISYFETLDIQGNCIFEVQKRLLIKPDSEYLFEPIDWSNEKSNFNNIEKFSIERRFNFCNKIIEEKAPDQSILRYNYDSQNQLRVFDLLPAEKPVSLPLVNNIRYDASGQKEFVFYGNGMETQFTYEKSTKYLQRIETRHDTKSLQDITYSYDPVGNIIQLNDQTYAALFSSSSSSQKPLPPQKYTYDSLSRIKESTGKTLQPNEPFTDNKQIAEVAPSQVLISNLKNKLLDSSFTFYKEKYEYDKSNNLTKKKHQETIFGENVAKKDWSKVYDIHEDSQQLKSLPYDKDGNQERLENNIELSWNYLNQLIYAKKIVEKYIIEEIYSYNSNGERTRKLTQKSQNGKFLDIIETLYVGNYELKRQISVVNLTATVETAVKTLRCYIGENLVAIYHHANLKRSEKLLYQLTNHLHSTAVEIDDKGELFSYEEYLPYGGTSFIVTNSQETLEMKNYHYSSKERDEITGLYYYGARYYSTEQGRWLSVDPLGISVGFNIYEFVRNNPINQIDEDGKIPTFTLKRKNNENILTIHNSFYLINKHSDLILTQNELESLSENFKHAIENTWKGYDPNLGLRWKMKIDITAIHDTEQNRLPTFNRFNMGANTVDYINNVFKPTRPKDLILITNAGGEYGMTHTSKRIIEISHQIAYTTLSESSFWQKSRRLFITREDDNREINDIDFIESPTDSRLSNRLKYLLGFKSNAYKLQSKTIAHEFGHTLFLQHETSIAFELRNARQNLNQLINNPSSSLLEIKKAQKLVNTLQGDFYAMSPYNLMNEGNEKGMLGREITSRQIKQIIKKFNVPYKK